MIGVLDKWSRNVFNQNLMTSFQQSKFLMINCVINVHLLFTLLSASSLAADLSFQLLGKLKTKACHFFRS